MKNNNRQITQILIWLMTRTTGGKTRTQIIQSLKQTPQNANQLSTGLKFSYKTICHHLGVLQKNRLLISTGNTYPTVYFLSETMEENYEIFQEITSPKKLNAAAL